MLLYTGAGTLQLAEPGRSVRADAGVAPLQRQLPQRRRLPAPQHLVPAAVKQCDSAGGGVAVCSGFQSRLYKSSTPRQPAPASAGTGTTTRTILRMFSRSRPRQLQRKHAAWPPGLSTSKNVTARAAQPRAGRGQGVLLGRRAAPSYKLGRVRPPARHGSTFSGSTRGPDFAAGGSQTKCALLPVTGPVSCVSRRLRACCPPSYQARRK